MAIKQKQIDMKTVISIFLALTIAFFSNAQSEVTYSFTIEGMTCDNCANTCTQALAQMKGVQSAKVDFESKTATVVAVESVTQEDLKQKIKEKNFEALFDDESLQPPLTSEERENLSIRDIKGGGKIKIDEHLVEGGITIFDFYADWCGPCKVFSPKVERLLLNHAKVNLVKVDIVDWKSALSKQLTQKYQMPSLPFVLVFNDKGKLLGKVHGNFIEKVEAIVEKNEE